MSEALPDTVTMPPSTAPAAGLWIVTVGTRLSFPLKVTVLPAQVRLPELSMARAVSV